MTNQFTKWISLSAIIIIIDQITKTIITANYKYGEQTYITSFLNIIRAHNEGAAFSFLANAGGWQKYFFTILAIIVSAFIITLLYKAQNPKENPEQKETKLYCLSLSLILSGALGNAIDRIIYGYVIDFVDFHFTILSKFFYQGHYPAFNVADIAITSGAAILIIDEIIKYKKTNKN